MWSVRYFVAHPSSISQHIKGWRLVVFLSELPAAASLQYKATVVKSLPRRVNYKFLSV